MVRKTLGDTESILRFSVGIGTQDVRLDGGKVVGRWNGKSQVYKQDEGRPLVERFVNLPATPESALKFTEKYGPLSGRQTDDAIGGGGSRFEFQVKDWLLFQGKVRQRAKRLASSKAFAKELGGGGMTDANSTRFIGPLVAHDFKNVEAGDLWHFSFGNGEAVFQAKDLATYLQIQFEQISPEYIRPCINPECDKVLFELDGRVTNCGYQECKLWAKRQSGKKTWHKYKDQWAAGNI